MLEVCQIIESSLYSSSCDRIIPYIYLLTEDNLKNQTKDCPTKKLFHKCIGLKVKPYIVIQNINEVGA